MPKHHLTLSSISYLTILPPYDSDYHDLPCQSFRLAWKKILAAAEWDVAPSLLRSFPVAAPQLNVVKIFFPSLTSFSLLVTLLALTFSLFAMVNRRLSMKLQEDIASQQQFECELRQSKRNFREVFEITTPVSFF
jgi:hypothetical protein